MKLFFAVILVCAYVNADIISKNVFHALIKKDLGGRTYTLRCARCHGDDGKGVKDSPINGNSLDGYATISDLFLKVKKTHSGYWLNPKGIDEIGLIFSLRYVKDRLGGTPNRQNHNR
jgi:hypothetical protein